MCIIFYVIAVSKYPPTYLLSTDLSKFLRYVNKNIRAELLLVVPSISFGRVFLYENRLTHNQCD